MPRGQNTLHDGLAKASLGKTPNQRVYVNHVGFHSVTYLNKMMAIFTAGSYMYSELG